MRRSGRVRRISGSEVAPAADRRAEAEAVLARLQRYAGEARSGASAPAPNAAREIDLTAAAGADAPASVEPVEPADEKRRPFAWISSRH